MLHRSNALLHCFYKYAMRYSEILESFPYAPGSTMPDHITDYRKVGPNRTRRIKTDQITWDDKFGQIPFYYTDKAKTTNICMTKSGGVIVYYYGSKNIIKWMDLYHILENQHDSKFGAPSSIAVWKTGYSLPHRREIGGWGGDRTK